MSVIRPHFLLCLLPVLAGAQEPSGLEQVKQDLKTLPTVRKESERPDLRLPSIAAPSPATDLPAPRPPTARPGAASGEAKPDKGTGNWLVDAMMNGASRPTTGSDRKATKARDDAHPLGAENEENERDPNQNPDRDRNAEREPLLGSRARESALAAENPLAPFMADWISKRDHPLLLPKNSAGQGFGSETSGLSGSPDQPVTIVFGGIGGRPDPVAGPAPLQPAENPFLQALQSPPVPPPAVAPTLTFPEAADRTPVLTSPPPARDARPPPPIDLSKPSQDTKYFPQLKRF